MSPINWVKHILEYKEAANNIKYRDIDSGEWVSPSLEDQVDAFKHHIQPKDMK